jgi:transcription elongation GreA/GreB family factor
MAVWFFATAFGMNKQRILESIIAQLRAELDLLTSAARGAREGATGDEAKSEGKYDTRAIEAGYLADGQAKVAAEFLAALEAFQKLSSKTIGPGDPIVLGALIQIAQGGAKDWFILGPGSGGLIVKEEGVEVAVITPHSPMGRSVLGHKTGDTVELNLGGAKREAKIVSVE